MDGSHFPECFLPWNSRPCPLLPVFVLHWLLLCRILSSPWLYQLGPSQKTCKWLKQKNYDMKNCLILVYHFTHWKKWLREGVKEDSKGKSNSKCRNPPPAETQTFLRVLCPLQEHKAWQWWRNVREAVGRTCWVWAAAGPCRLLRGGLPELGTESSLSKWHRLQTYLSVNGNSACSSSG